MNESDDFARLSLISKCPLFGGELERGYIISSAIWWDTERRLRMFRGLNGLLTKAQIGETQLPALRCRKCSFVMFYPSYCLITS